MMNARVILAGLCLVSVAGLSVGQDNSGESGREPGQKPPVLQGPSAPDNRPELLDRRFGGSQEGAGNRMRAMKIIPPKDLQQALKALLSEDAEPAVRLSADQEKKIRELVAQFEQDRRAYQKEHRAELAKLRREAGLGREIQRAERDPSQQTDGRARRNLNTDERTMREPITRQQAIGNRPGRRQSVDQQPTPEQARAREKMRAIMQAGPQAADLQQKIYAELTQAQREFVDARIAEFAEQRAQERDMQRFERRRKDRQAEQRSQRRPRQVTDWSRVYNEDGTVNLDALPARVADRLKPLSEADRKRGVEIYRQRVERGQRERDRRMTPKYKNPPPLDRVDVPKPKGDD
ncbi:MAG TPA: hypothetical protein ENJ00_04735 [Phycisphaerales bacterium]|nr:hypothetical protein [Phycisphaerales bacterium]